MNKFYRITIIAVMVLLPMLSSGSHAEEPYVVFNNPKTKPNSGIGIKVVNERLIARDIGGLVADWCGNRAVVLYGDGGRIEWVDFLSKKRVKVNTTETKENEEEIEIFNNCSPDGEWVVYADRSSFRFNKEPGLMHPDDQRFSEVLVSFYKDGWVVDIYRYEVATNKRERFAVAPDSGKIDMVSPDGKQVFLGYGYDSGVEMDEPKWIKRGFTKYRVPHRAKWFKDSSGVVSAGLYNLEIGNTIYEELFGLHVQFFGKDGWFKTFQLEPEFSHYFEFIGMDEQNRIYYLANEDSIQQPDGNSFLYQCEIYEKKLSCEKLIVFTGYTNALFLLPGGDVVYSESNDLCIRRITPGQKETECLVDTRYGNKIYSGISLYGVSPDGRWLLFKRYNRIVGNDLFVLKLKDNK